MRLESKAMLCTAVAGVFFATKANGGEARWWNGADGSNWSNDGNWDSSIPPGVDDEAFFPSLPIFPFVTLDADRTIYQMAFQDPPSGAVGGQYVLSKSNNALLTVTDRIYLVPGVFSSSSPTFNGFRVNAGGASIEGNSFLSITNNSQVNCTGEFFLTDSGSVDLVNSTASGNLHTVYDPNILNIKAGSTFNAGTLAMDFGGHVHTFFGGTLTLNGNGTISNGYLTVEQGGTFKMLSAGLLGSDGGSFIDIGDDLALPSGSTLRASNNGANGGQVTVGGVLTLAATGAGSLLVSGAGSAGSFGSGTSAASSIGNAGVATVLLSAGGLADFNRGLNLATGGGLATIGLTDGGQLNVDQSLNVGGTGAATINISSGQGGISVLSTTGTAQFNKTTINIDAGGQLSLGGNATFSSNTTVTNSAGTLALANGASLTVNGVVHIGSSAATEALSNGATLRIVSGGQFKCDNYFDIGNSNTGGASGTLIVDGANSAITSGGLYSDWGRNTGNAATITFVSGGVGTFGAGVTMSGNGGSALLTLVSGGELHASGLSAGSQGGSATININGGLLDVTGQLTLNGALVQYNSGTMQVSGELDMFGGARLNCYGAAKTLQLGGLSIANDSAIDLALNQALGIDKDALGPVPLQLIRGMIASGYAGGAWDGAGIQSTSAADNNASSAQKLGLAYADFGGYIGVILLRAGDANFDEVVNALDFNALATNYGKTNQFWMTGDFNYDGLVDSTDFDLMANNFGQTLVLGAPALSTLVPEPGMMAAFCALGLLYRRRRSV